MHPAYQAYTMLHCIPATHTNHQYYNHRHTRDTSWTTDAVPGVPKGREPVWWRRDKKDIYLSIY